MANNLPVNLSESALQNLLDLVDSVNAGGPSHAAQVTVSNLQAVSNVEGNPTADTSLQLDAVEGQGFSGSVTITYDRLALADQVAAESGSPVLGAKMSAAQTLAAVSKYYNILASEISWVSDPAAGATTGTIQTSGSIIYNDAQEAVNLGWSAKTVLLLHLDGANGSTTIVDEVGNTMSLLGGTLTTASHQFGTAEYAGLADGTGGISTPDDLSFHLGEFTFECFYTPAAGDLSGESMLFSKGLGSYLDVYQNAWYVSMGESNVHLVNGVAANLVAGTTYHVALTRDASNNITLWLNGQSVATTSSSLAFGNDTDPMLVGAYKNRDIGVQGNLDEVRISNVARYTAAFTPPSAPFTLD